MLFPGGFFYLVIKPRLQLVLGCIDLIVATIRRTPPPVPHRKRHWHSPAEGRDLGLNTLAVVAVCLLMGWQVGIGRFWSLYAPLMTMAAALFICVFFVQHNFPGSFAHRTDGWSAMAGVVEGTSDLDLPPLLHWFTADIGCHAMHHLCDAIPNYRLRAAHNQMPPC
jgi:omega-6 fatty acid desaturase (delta-12 desaturase)